MGSLLVEGGDGWIFRFLPAGQVGGSGSSQVLGDKKADPPGWVQGWNHLAGLRVGIGLAVRSRQRSGRIPAEPYPPFKSLQYRTNILA